MDPDNPYRYIQIRGRVSRAVEAGADAHIDSLAKKYLGKEAYPFRQPGEVRSGQEQHEKLKHRADDQIGYGAARQGQHQPNRYFKNQVK